MEYLCLIYTDEKQWANLSNAEREAVYKEYFAFTESIQQSGHFKGGNPLEKSDTATLVRVRDGKTATTDGPYAETKEQLGGFWVVDVPDLDAALDLAARGSKACGDAVEVRPFQGHES